MHEITLQANGVKAVCRLGVDSTGTHPPGLKQGRKVMGTGSAITKLEIKNSRLE